MTVFEKKLAQAEEGRNLWRKWEEKYPENVVFLLLAEGNSSLLTEIQSFLPQFLEEKGYDSAVILQIQGIQGELDFESYQVETLTLKQGEAILSLYEMYQFTPRLRIVSLQRPYGSKLQHLQDFLPENTKELVRTCLLY